MGSLTERLRRSVSRKLAPLALPTILLAGAACGNGNIPFNANFPTCENDPRPKFIGEGNNYFVPLIRGDIKMLVGGIEISKGNKPAGEFDLKIIEKDIVISNLPTGGIVFKDPKTDRTISISGTLSDKTAPEEWFVGSPSGPGTILTIKAICPSKEN